MWKWISGIIVVVFIAVGAYWLTLDKHVRYLFLNPPKDLNVLFWTIEQRDAGFQSIDKLFFVPKNKVKKGQHTSELVPGSPLNLNEQKIAEYFDTLRIGGLIVIHNNQLKYERYGLDSTPTSKWTSFSVAKSVTSTLVGAAIKDGHIKSLDDKVTDYVTSMKGSAYDDVTIEQLITMTSGVDWNEDYNDPESDVSKFNFHKPEPGVDAIASYMRQLKRAHPPGSTWRYSTGETNLIGLVLQRAIERPLSDYLSEKIWSQIGPEYDASWVLGPSKNEIGGCCIQATTRDFARFGQFVLDGTVIDGKPIVADGWLANATSKQADTGDKDGGYGYQWWVSDDGTFQGKGIFGQGIFIDPKRNLVIAINGNWPTALGHKYTKGKQSLYEWIQAEVDNQVLTTQAF